MEAAGFGVEVRGVEVRAGVGSGAGAAMGNFACTF